MKIESFEKTPARRVNIEGAKGVRLRWLISQKDAAPNFWMRMFEVEDGGHTPLHSHDFEHEVFILEGEGVLICDSEEKPFGPGYVIYVPPGSMHQFQNSGKGTMRFLCLVPAGKGL